MLNHWITLATLAFALLLAACPRSSAEAEVIGTWQYDPKNGAVWRYTFAPDHTVVLSIPHDDYVDVNLANAKFDPMTSGTWRLDGKDVVYTMKSEHEKNGQVTATIKKTEFGRYWVRVK
jgi:hypothetical protein